MNIAWLSAWHVVDAPSALVMGTRLCERQPLQSGFFRWGREGEGTAFSSLRLGLGWGNLSLQGPRGQSCKVSRKGCSELKPKSVPEGHYLAPHSSQQAAGCVPTRTRGAHT